jgi:hypothetical protein
MPRHLIETDIQDSAISNSTLWSSERTKAYADAIAAGLDPKEHVRAASVASITLSGEQTVDGVALVTGDRFLDKDNSTASLRGIYIVSTGAWTRAEDADTSEKIEGMFCFVAEGTVNAGKMFNLVTDDITLGTTSLTYSPFGSTVDLSGYTPLVGADDVEITDETKGFIIKSPDGTRWRIRIGNDGALNPESL